ncbi:hypothetical protein J437_LFUL007309 [Ladona fulva]|uniref:Reverse transcriptase n=1 Tax=Ladona fulva TaxID=123851 RepID=A0A8K0KSF4_LADFU|nr:hypothetical protein J437_LFUL007309 [Ladona fulva]
MLDRDNDVYDKVAYPDDVIILVEGDSRLVLERAGTDTMNKVFGWADAVGLTISPSKSQLCFAAHVTRALPKGVAAMQKVLSMAKRYNLPAGITNTYYRS